MNEKDHQILLSSLQSMYWKAEIASTLKVANISDSQMCLVTLCVTEKRLTSTSYAQGYEKSFQMRKLIASDFLAETYSQKFHRQEENTG